MKTANLRRSHIVFGFVVAIGVSIAFAAANSAISAGEKKPKTDAESVQGVWSVSMLEADGKPEDKSNYVGNTMTFSGDKATLKEWNHEPAEFTFKLDPDAKPKTIDLGAGDMKLLGIYQLDGDDLKLCISIGGDRPTAFKTEAGDHWEIMTLKRGTPGENLAWKRFEAKKFGFSIEMPGEPEERVRTTDTAAGNIEATFYVVRSDAERLSYMAMTMKMPNASATKQEIEQFLDLLPTKMLDEAGKGANSEVVKKEDFKQGDYSGREMSFTLTVPGALHKGAGRLRVFRAGDRFYALMVVGIEDSIGTKNVERFWESFKAVVK